VHISTLLWGFCWKIEGNSWEIASLQLPSMAYLHIIDSQSTA